MPGWYSEGNGRKGAGRRHIKKLLRRNYKIFHQRDLASYECSRIFNYVYLYRVNIGKSGSLSMGCDPSVYGLGFLMAFPG
jgi:hypothetical protein